MLPALPSLRQLAYLVALHEHRHFGRAALACFVTQSTLSVGIAELERLLGTQLVERSTRNVRFTNIGADMVVRARGLLRAAEDLCAAAQGARAPLVGTLHMAAIPTVAPFLLPRVMLDIAASWPQLELFVREMLTGPACDALQRGTVDCILLALPVECGDLESVEISVDRLLLATRDGGEADDPHAVIASDAIDPARLLLLEDGHCLKDHALAACDLKSRPAEARVVASTLQTLVQLVDADLGVTLLPELAVSAGLLSGTRVACRTLGGVNAERRIALAWRRGHTRASDLRLLGQAIRTIVQAIPADGL